jgi:type IV secretory pathway VirB3-like protein
MVVAASATVMAVAIAVAAVVEIDCTVDTLPLVVVVVVWIVAVVIVMDDWMMMMMRLGRMSRIVVPRNAMHQWPRPPFHRQMD